MTQFNNRNSGDPAGGMCICSCVYVCEYVHVCVCEWIWLCVCVCVFMLCLCYLNLSQQISRWIPCHKKPELQNLVGVDRQVQAYLANLMSFIYLLKVPLQISAYLRVCYYVLFYFFVICESDSWKDIKFAEYIPQNDNQSFYNDHKTLKQWEARISHGVS